MSIMITCPKCGGTGKYVIGWGSEVKVVNCLTCHGKGKIALKNTEIPEPNKWEVKNLPSGDFEIVRI